MLEIGVITKPQGLKGEVRIKNFSDNYEIYESVNYLIIDNKKYEFEKTQNRNGFAVVKFLPYNSINEIMFLIGKKVFIEKSDIQLNEDEYLVDDLIGFEVFDNTNKLIGILTEINSFGAGDIYYVKTVNKSEIIFPNARDIIIDILADDKKIIVDANILEEVKVEN